MEWNILKGIAVNWEFATGQMYLFLFTTTIFTHMLSSEYLIYHIFFNLGQPRLTGSVTTIIRVSDTSGASLVEWCEQAMTSSLALIYVINFAFA